MAMVRLRRYRVFLAFSVIFLFSLLHLARTRGWSSIPDLVISTPDGHNSPSDHTPPDLPPPPPPSPPAASTPEAKPPTADQNEEPYSSHGFAPEPLAAGLEDKEPLKSKPAVDTSNDYQVSDPPSSHSGSSSSPSPSSSASTSPNQKDHIVHSGSASESHLKGSLSSDSSPPPKDPFDYKKYEENTFQPPQLSPQGEGRVEVSLPPAGRPEPHWKKYPEHFPVPEDELIHLPTARPKSLPKLQATLKDESSTEKLDRSHKLTLIKEAFVHAWTGYSTQAMGHDEVRPKSGGHRDPFNGWGATLVDALDTLWIMGLKDEFANAVDEVKKIDFTTSLRKDIPLFETTIRYLGGLLGAHDISNHKYPVLLDKAVELAEILIGAFDTPNRMPQTFYNWAPDYVSQPHRASTNIVLAELGSLTLEFTRLAQLTKEDKYYDAVARITNELEIWQNNTRLPGLWPLRVDGSGCEKVQQNPPASNAAWKAPSVADANPTKPRPTDVDSYSKFIQKRSDTEGGLEADAEPANYGAIGSSVGSPSTGMTKSYESLCPDSGLRSPAHTYSEEYGLGALADSTYEYLPKEYMLLGGLNDQYPSMYSTAMQTTREKLVFRPMIKEGDRDLRFVAQVTLQEGYGDTDETLRYKYDGTHLTCFVGGMFAIASKLFGIKDDLELASKMADACVWAYEATPTGIMPENFEFVPCADVNKCPWNETIYQDILDPNHEERIAQAERQYQLQLQIAKDYYDRKQALKALENPQAPSEFPSTPNTAYEPPVIPASSREAHVPPESPGTANTAYKPPVYPGSSGAEQVPPEVPGPSSKHSEDASKVDHILKRDVHDSDSRPKPDYASQSTAETVSQTDRDFAQDPEFGKKTPPTKSSTGAAAAVANDDKFVPPIRPDVPTHEEYVQQRVKSERLPDGMTKVSGKKYILRPEAIESVFIMFRLTGDNYWREKGWKMFQAVDRATRTKFGHSAISDVTSEAPWQLDEMESFWLAETLKYFYLLFADTSVVSLDEYVLNTEAHPLKRPT